MKTALDEQQRGMSLLVTMSLCGLRLSGKRWEDQGARCWPTKEEMGKIGARRTRMTHRGVHLGYREPSQVVRGMRESEKEVDCVGQERQG